MRARNIKPGYYRNEDLAECSIWARYIFPGLWMLADREGLLEDRPKRIKADLLPFDSVEVDPLLAELAQRGFILRYEVNGVRYIQVLRFKRHQNPHHREQPSKLPKPEAAASCNEQKAPGSTEALDPSIDIARGESRADSLTPDSLTPDSKPSAASEKISLSAAGEWEGISQDTQNRWAKAYPAVDLDAELAAMVAWVFANPKNRKSNWERFITHWLKKAQDKAPPKGGGQKPTNKPAALTCEYADPGNGEVCGRSPASRDVVYGNRALCNHHLLKVSPPKTEIPSSIRAELAQYRRKGVPA